jgi:hypothetical protein
MRVRDIVRNSLEQLVTDGTLPAYQHDGFYKPAPRRDAMPWRPDQLELLHHAVARGPLYHDSAAWRAAVDFVKAFAASTAARGEPRWRIDAFCGAFADIPADDLLHQVTAALASCGLSCVGSNTITRTAYFEATDTPKVSALPEPYGKWFQIREDTPRWQEPVALRLIAQTHTRIVLRPDGRFDGYVDMRISAPALSLLPAVATRLGRSIPRLTGRLWLPSATRTP